MHGLEQIIEDFYTGAASDYVGLWELVNAVDSRLRPSGSDDRRELTLEVVRQLIARGLLAVDLASVGGGCVPWRDQQPDSVLRRIRAEWEALGRDPDIGDIAWFSLPK